jgi:hypothetical protein
MFLMPFSQSDKPVKMFSCSCANYASLRTYSVRYRTTVIAYQHDNGYMNKLRYRYSYRVESDMLVELPFSGRQ